jgi:hypothetical protein
MRGFSVLSQATLAQSPLLVNFLTQQMAYVSLSPASPVDMALASSQPQPRCPPPAFVRSLLYLLPHALTRSVTTGRRCQPR